MAVDTTRGQNTVNYRQLRGIPSATVDGKRKQLPLHNAQPAGLDLLPVLGAWFESDNPMFSVEGSESVSFNGKTHNLIRVRLREAGKRPEEVPTFELVLDPSNSIVNALRWEATPSPYPTDRARFENRFSNYKNCGGLLFPTRIERYREGRLLTVMLINTIQANVGLSDADFKN